MTLLLLTLLLAGSPAAEPPPPSDEAHLDVVRAKEAEILARVRSFDEARYAELLALKERDPRAYLRALLRIGALTDALRERPDPPAVREQEARLAALRARHPQGLTALPAAELAAARAELTDIAARIFDARQAERRRRIDELRLALAELEAEVSTRDTNRELLIRTWVEKQLSEAP